LAAVAVLPSPIAAEVTATTWSLRVLDSSSAVRSDR
jgi:hypothetical protein